MIARIHHQSGDIQACWITWRIPLLRLQIGDEVHEFTLRAGAEVDYDFARVVPALPPQAEVRP